MCPPAEAGLSARVYLDPGFTMIGLAMARSIGRFLDELKVVYFLVPIRYVVFTVSAIRIFFTLLGIDCLSFNHSILFIFNLFR